MGGYKRMPITPKMETIKKEIDTEFDIDLLETEISGTYLVWLPFVYGLDSEPI